MIFKRGMKIPHVLAASIVVLQLFLILPANANIRMSFSDHLYDPVPEEPEFLPPTGRYEMENTQRDYEPGETVEQEFTIPVAFFRLIPDGVTPDGEWVLHNEQVLDVIERSLENSSARYNGANFRFSVAKFESHLVSGSGPTDHRTLVSQIYNSHYNEMACVFILYHSYRIGNNDDNCGGYYPGTKKVEWSEGCMMEFSSDILSHEMGHYFGLDHTFAGNSLTQPNVFRVVLPDGSIGDYSSACPDAEFSDGTNCLTHADELCSTPAEINSTCTQIKNADVEWWAYDTEFNVWLEGGGMYVPNYTHPAYTEHPFWSRHEYYDMNLNLVDPCKSVSTVYDCTVGFDIPMVKPFEEFGYYNVMTYIGGECPMQFTQEQIDLVKSNIISYSRVIKIQNVFTDLYVTLNGDTDGDPLTFSHLAGAADFISSDHYQNYRIFILPDYDGLESEPIVFDGNNMRDQLPDYPGRKIFVDIYGVSSLEGAGQDLTWELAPQGEIVIQQNSIACNEPIRVRGLAYVTMERLEIHGFGNGLVVDALSTEATALDFRGCALVLEDCSFVQNGVGSVLCCTPGSCGGAVLFAPVEDPSLLVENCIFANNVSPGGDAVALSMLGVSESDGEICQVHKSTFTSNSYTPNASNIGALHLEANGLTKVFNCSFSGSDPIHGTPGNQQPIIVDYGLPTNMLAEFNYCLFDQDIWLQTHILELNATNVIISNSDDVGFVDSDGGDYRLRWNSVCLEKGDPTVLDFDETRSDIGWSPDYPEEEISGTAEIDKPGHYLVTGTTTVHSVDDVLIPDGTVLKMDGAYNLFIKDSNPANGFNISVGDPHGARTSIVGSNSYCSICFGNDGAGADVADCSFDGVLFNKLTNGGINGFMRFSNCNVDLDGASGNVKFNQCEELELYFAEICQGSFKNFDFTATQIDDGVKGFGWLDIVNSDVDILNVKFDEIPGAASGDSRDDWFWKVMHSGTVPGNPSHVVAGCDFPCQDNGYGVCPVYAGNTSLKLHHNDFRDIEIGAINTYATELAMANGAMNQFEKSIVWDYRLESMISGVQNPVDMYCGHNTFLHLYYSTIYQFVESDCQSSNWSRNYWGVDCSTPIDPLSNLPTCVTSYSPALSSCPTVPMVCNEQLGEESPLYELGVEADAIFNYEAACVYWTELMVEFPESKYCTSVTSSMKAIGLLTDYGVQAFGLIRADLESAAVESETVDFLLSVNQRCSALCVEARHGDRPAALALLNSLLLEVKGSKDAESLINLAIAEIGMYPEQGGMSTMGPEMEVARFERQLQGLRDYQQALLPESTRARIAQEGRETGEQATQPGEFQLVACYPNPFNPVTSIELECTSDKALLLEIYNLAGQRVDVVHEGMVSAGKHVFKWDASNMASGIYFLRAEQGSKYEIAKLMLMR